MSNEPSPSNCRWLDRYFGDVCRNERTNPSRTTTSEDITLRATDGKEIVIPAGSALFAEPKCKRCEGCGYEPISPDKPAWDETRSVRE